MENKREMTAPNVSVGADTEQPIQKCTDHSISDYDENIKSFEEMQREMLRQLSPSYLKTVSMAALYDTVFDIQTPLIDGLLQRGTYLFVGSPKVGKSFMMAQLAYHISTGTPLWDYKVRKTTVLYCNESIKKVYHELFDEALARYNAKQTRADRKIENYYEKIRSSKQEKPFHELILQIGDKENMSAESENGQLARQVLDAYYREFQARNPNLYVFSAHLHMDEATPHMHIDFVPFTTGSKRGLDTRVSLKQALAAQGFKGGSRSETEWNQWVQSEKKQLAAVMERYGIEWEQKGTHEKHLSVLDYKKQQRTEEIERLESKITDKQTEFETLSKRIQNFDKGTASLSQMQNVLENAPEYQLPEPQGFMTAKSYKSKIVEPLVKRLKSLIKTLMVRCFQAIDDYQRLNQTNASLYRSNEKFKNHNKQLISDNNRLREEIKDYKLLRKVFGSRQIDSLLEQAKQSKQRGTRFRNKENER